MVSLNEQFQLMKCQPLGIPFHPWEVISMDFITDLPKTERSHDSILVIMDSVSKRVHLIKFNMTWGAVETAKLYFQEIFKHHGLSDRIVSDRDTRFTSKFWQELCRLLGTRVAMSTSFHPQTNGANERSHKVIEEMLRRITQLQPTDWDEKLPLLKQAHHWSYRFN